MKVVGVQKYNRMDDGTIRVSAVDWWRMMNPLKNLNYPILKEIVGVEQDPNQAYSTLGIKYDILMTSYIDTPVAYAYLRAIYKKFGVKHIMDLDDNLFQIDETNPAFKRYNPASKEYYQAHTIIKDVDHLVVSTEQLKRVVERYGRRKPTFVIPNAIDLDVYNFDMEKAKRFGKKVTIVYQGSSTHYKDLMESGFYDALQVLIHKYKDRVIFKVIGMDYDELHSLPKKNVEIIYGKNNFWDWVDLWKKEMADVSIGIAPLIDNVFNECKSNIKFQEYSACRVPTIASNVGPYAKLPNDKLTKVENTAKSWYEALEKLFLSKELREKQGNEAYEYVKEKMSVKNVLEDYKNLFKTVYDS